MKDLFKARPDDPILTFTWPGGWIRLNQRFLETCTKTQFKRAMRACNGALPARVKRRATK